MTPGPVIAKRALVTGGARSDVLIVKRLKELGWFVTTGGTDPRGPAHRFADDYIPFDYSDAEQVLGAAKRARATCLVPSGHDRAVQPAALAAQALGLPGHDSPSIASKIHQKDQLKEQLTHLNIPTPRKLQMFELHEFLENSGRVIVKPIGLAGGRGISIASSIRGFREATAHAHACSGDPRVVVEEYMEGTHHGVSLMIVNGQCEILFSDNEYFGENPFRVWGAHSRSDLETDDLANIRRWMQLLADELQLTDGLLHLQVMRTKNGVRVVEVMRRVPGDGYPKLPELAFGLNFVDQFLKPYVGEKSTVAPPQTRVRNVIRHVVGSRANGRYTGLEVGAYARKFLIDMFIWARPGEEVDEPQTWSAGALYFSSPNNEFDALLSSVKEECTVSLQV